LSSSVAPVPSVLKIPAAHTQNPASGLCDRISATTSYLFPIDRAPTFVQQIAAHAFANVPTRAKSHPCNNPYDNPPMHASPAPVESTTFTLNGFTCTVFPPPASKHPSGPIVTATVFGPMASSFAAIFS